MKESVKSVALCSAVYFIFCCVVSSRLCLNAEDLVHCQAETFRQGLEMAWGSYMFHNARLGECLIYVLPGMGVDPWMFFRISQIVVLSLLPHLCFRLGVGHWAGQCSGDAWGLVFCIFSVLSIHSGIYWYCSNVCWLYPCTAVLAFFILLERIFQGDFQLSSKYLFLLPLAVVTGMSNENVSLTSVLFFWGAWIYAMHKQKRWIRPSATYLALAGVLLASSLFYLLAPGNMARAGEAAGKVGENMGSSWLLHNIFSMNSIINHFICQLRPYLMFGLLLACYFMMKKTPLQHLRRWAALGAAYFILWGIVLPSPCWGQPRAYVPMEIILDCALVGMFMQLIVHGLSKRFTAVLLSVHVFIALSIIVPQTWKVYWQSDLWDRLCARADAAAASGERELVLDARSLEEEHPIPGMSWCPRFLFKHDVCTYAPLRPCTRDEVVNRKESSGFYGGIPAVAADIRNLLVARKHGLEAIWCVKEESSQE